MNLIYPIDRQLTDDLVKKIEGEEYMLKLEQIEMHLLAFEKKIRHYTRDELLCLRMCLQTYRKLVPDSEPSINLTYLRILNHYLKRQNR